MRDLAAILTGCRGLILDEAAPDKEPVPSTDDYLPQPVVGCPAQSFFDGAWFDASSGTWTYLPKKFSGGLGPAVWTGSAMVVFATKAGTSTRPLYGPADIPAGAAAAFDPSTGAWTDLARCPIPDLANASLAWTGRQLIVVTMNDGSGDTPQVEVLSKPVQHST